MKLSLLLLSIATMVGSAIFAQTITMPTSGTSSTSACSGTFYDPGGTGNYQNNCSSTYTICPSTAGSKLKIVFTSFSTESCCDYLTIYDGNSTSAPTLGTYAGTLSPGTVQATPTNASGCLTFVFYSDFITRDAGWVGTISCIAPCQSITSNLVSTNEAAAADGIIRICQGQSVNFVGSGTFGTSGTGATYTWSMGNGATVSGTNINYTWPAVGSYLVNLTVTDPSGCTNSNSINQQVQVSTTPTITTSASPSSLCTNQTSNLSANVTMNSYTVNCTPPVSGTTFLPDGSGTSYSTSITTSCYAPGTTVTAATDITSICLNMEHSYLGDLSIDIQCPNGQSATLEAYGSGGGSANLGFPWATGAVDGSSSTTTPGTGSTYCFTPTASTTLVGGIVSGGTFTSGNGPGTYTDSYVPAGNYAPATSFSSLVGCPLNGSWTIVVTDHLAADNGYIFDWDINFTSALITASSFTPTIVSQGWVPQATLTSSGATTANVVPTSTGSPCYTYSVTDNFGCTYTQPQCITVSCTALPVGILDFTANQSGDEVSLNWVTSSEQNSDRFYVQRSQDGAIWSSIGSMQAAGNSYHELTYALSDREPAVGLNYYRLIETDLDGKTTVSEPLSVQFDLNGIMIYPNPATSYVTILGVSVSDEIRLIDVSGHELKCKPDMINGNTAEINLSDVAKGVYTIVVRGTSYKFIKQ